MKINAAMNIVVSHLASVVVFATAADAWWSRSKCMDVETVDDFDLEEYASAPWYVQQQAENWYSQKGSKCTKAEYTLLEEKNWWGYTIDVKNTAISKSGADLDADLCAGYNPERESELFVSQCFAPSWLAGDYWVIEYDEDEGYALISGGKPKYEVKGDKTCGDSGDKQCCKTSWWSSGSELFVFTREQNPSDELVEKVRGLAKKNGFSTEVLFDVSQSNCEKKNDIPSVAIENGSFKTLVKALKATDLVDALSEPNGPLTVFAPTDDAFNKLPEGALNCLLRDKERLTKILTYHVASGEVKSTDLSDGLKIKTLSGETAIADLSDGVKINESTVIIPDVAASNGVIHVIDTVLLPPGVDAGCDIPGVAIENGSFKTLVTALKATDLVGALSAPNGPLTVFAPTDDAFAKLPKGELQCLLKDPETLTEILKYHVASGEVKSTDLSDGLEIETLSGEKAIADLSDGVKINESTVIIPDVGATNGVIHVIDTVLLPPGVGPNFCDIPTVAIQNGSFRTLVTALKATDLVGALAQPKASEPNGPLTVFAPTDDAFNKLPKGSVKCLLKDPETLTKILKYHVASGEVKSTDLSDGLKIKTLLGETAIADLSDGVKINDSTVIIPDVGASNGVIHVIDTVLLPPGVGPNFCDIPSVAIANGSFRTLVTALKATDLVGALSEPNGPLTVFAPTDDAFKKLPKGSLTCLLKDKPLLTKILQYHVASGEVKSTDLSDGLEIETLLGEKAVADLSDGVKINESTVIIPDVGASNGVIHVIDTVLLPPDVDGVCDIPTVAIQNGSFKTLVTALKATDLVGALSAPNGPLTVFAPTDDAFKALPEGLLDCLLNDKPLLTKILQYHVASGEVKSTDLSDGLEITTLLEEKAVVDLSDGVKINDSVVIIPDVAASNGVIHVIDAVLVPGSVDVGEYLKTCEGKPICTDETHFKWGRRTRTCKWIDWVIGRRGKGYCNKKVGRRGPRVKEFCPATCGTCKLVV